MESGDHKPKARLCQFRKCESGAGLPERKTECCTASTKSGRGLMQSQRNGFVAVNRLKHKQYCDAVFFEFAAAADARIALDDEANIGKSAQIVKTIQIGQNLSSQTVSQS